MRLQDEVAIVTGAGSGFGRAGAVRFAAEGARVVAADIDAGAARETAALVEAQGGEAIAVRTDVRDEGDCAALVDAALSAFGRVSIVWANAGVPAPQAPIDDTRLDLFDAVSRVNVRGAWLTARACVPALRAGGGGAILFTASISGLKGRPNTSPYAASKGAVVQLTRALALELAPSIRVNSVCPVAASTPMLAGFLEGLPDPEAAKEGMVAGIPMGRLCTAEDVACAALFLVSGEASLVTGVNLPVDGGLSA